MIISVDHGNKSIKTPHLLFTSGLVESENQPGIKTDCIFWDGKYYSLTEKRISYLRDKTEDDRFFVLTLFAIAKELEYFQGFIDCLVEAVNISKDLKTRSDDVYEELRSRYGEELVNRATIYCALSDAIPDFEAKEPKFQEISSEIESAIDVSQNQEYALKVARYELREAFEVLIRNIQ